MPVRTSGLALSLSSLACLFAVWIVLPAPHYRVWQLAVAASEWSLWLALAGLAGASLGWRSFHAAGGKVSAAALVLGVCAAGLGVYPLLSGWQAAQANGVTLSFQRYFLGDPAMEKQALPETVVFNRVDGQELRLDIFLPTTQAETRRPAVIVIHGGGWDSRDKSDFPQWDAWLTQQGYAVFDIQYRLHPQPNWQTATGDVKCAIGWVKRNAAKYGVDAGRLALLGRSAGGHLALLAAYTPGAADLPSSCPLDDGQTSEVRAVVSFYAPVDMVWDFHNPANQRVIDGPDTIRRFVGGTPETAPAHYAGASPSARVTPQTPPTLLLQSGNDQLVRVENMQRLAGRLAAAGVVHRTLLLPYAQHGFDYNFNGWGSQVVQPVILQFLRENLSNS